MTMRTTALTSEAQQPPEVGYPSPEAPRPAATGSRSSAAGPETFDALPWSEGPSATGSVGFVAKMKNVEPNAAMIASSVNPNS